MIHQLRAKALHGMIHQGELTMAELAESTLARIEAFNPSLIAFVDADHADVMRQVETIEARRRAGETLPLLGSVFSIKDNLWLGGRPATYGSHVYRHHIAPCDSAVVARLKRLGALCIGITNCPEFACKGHTSNALHGTTRNPWDLDTTPGGSSGGAAAAVAAGLGTLALGTDAGGSIRRPAAHTGLVGFKPTHGLIPDPHGFDDPSYAISDIGVLAKSVEECAWLLDGAVFHDPRDPRSYPLPPQLSVDRPFTQALKHLDTQAIRIGWTRDLGCGFRLDEDVAAAFDNGIAALASAGLTLEHASPDWPAQTFEYPLLRQQQAALAAQFGHVLRDTPELLDPALADQITQGLRISGADYAADDLRRKAIIRALDNFFERFDFLLCPTTPVEAWPVAASHPSSIASHPASPRAHAAFTPLFNYCGVPALSLPFALGKRGLPLGWQLVGPRHTDLSVLALAHHLETIIDHRFDAPLWLADSDFFSSSL